MFILCNDNERFVNMDNINEVRVSKTTDGDFVILAESDAVVYELEGPFEDKEEAKRRLMVICTMLNNGDSE